MQILRCQVLNRIAILAITGKRVTKHAKVTPSRNVIVLSLFVIGLRTFLLVVICLNYWGIQNYSALDFCHCH